MKYPFSFQPRLFRPQMGVFSLLALALFGLAACGPAQPTSTASATSTSTPVPAATQPAAPASVEESNQTPVIAATGPAPTETADGASSGIVKLNLNTASNDEFLAVPDVGSRMVREFNEYRPYTSILQFRKEIGKYVDESQVAAYEEYLFVPVDPNSADVATLQQIPGVDEALATALIGARPFASNAAFTEKLAELLTPEQVTVAESYLVGQ